ncbi:hypothetical protein H4219_005488 [Mycoemilia scoparia]|uniref:Uncharacterized protein n=1 Tax=Mycoemilia scoparia TaxID=417184 RepID=A0A9W8DJS1_9FUNG|nr:hypothetical protein H4219_005488 [Mycoemilia scoparia]
MPRIMTPNKWFSKGNKSHSPPANSSSNNNASALHGPSTPNPKPSAFLKSVLSAQVRATGAASTQYSDRHGPQPSSELSAATSGTGERELNSAKREGGFYIGRENIMSSVAASLSSKFEHNRREKDKGRRKATHMGTINSGTSRSNANTRIGAKSLGQSSVLPELPPITKVSSSPDVRQGSAFMAIDNSWDSLSLIPHGISVNEAKGNNNASSGHRNSASTPDMGRSAGSESSTAAQSSIESPHSVSVSSESYVSDEITPETESPARSYSSSSPASTETGNTSTTVISAESDRLNIRPKYSRRTAAPKDTRIAADRYRDHHRHHHKSGTSTSSSHSESTSEVPNTRRCSRRQDIVFREDRTINSALECRKGVRKNDSSRDAIVTNDSRNVVHPADPSFQRVSSLYCHDRSIENGEAHRATPNGSRLESGSNDSGSIASPAARSGLESGPDVTNNLVTNLRGKSTRIGGSRNNNNNNDRNNVRAHSVAENSSSIRSNTSSPPINSDGNSSNSSNSGEHTCVSSRATTISSQERIHTQNHSTATHTSARSSSSNNSNAHHYSRSSSTNSVQTEARSSASTSSTVSAVATANSSNPRQLSVLKNPAKVKLLATSYSNSSLASLSKLSNALISASISNLSRESRMLRQADKKRKGAVVFVLTPNQYYHNVMDIVEADTLALAYRRVSHSQTHWYTTFHDGGEFALDPPQRSPPPPLANYNNTFNMSEYWPNSGGQMYGNQYINEDGSNTNTTRSSSRGSGGNELNGSSNNRRMPIPHNRSAASFNSTYSSNSSNSIGDNSGTFGHAMYPDRRRLSESRAMRYGALWAITCPHPDAFPFHCRYIANELDTVPMVQLVSDRGRFRYHFKYSKYNLIWSIAQQPTPKNKHTIILQCTRKSLVLAEAKTCLDKATLAAVSNTTASMTDIPALLRIALSSASTGGAVRSVESASTAGLHTSNVNGTAERLSAINTGVGEIDLELPIITLFTSLYQKIRTDRPEILESLVLYTAVDVLEYACIKYSAVIELSSPNNIIVANEHSAGRNDLESRTASVVMASSVGDPHGLKTHQNYNHHNVGLSSPHSGTNTATTISAMEFNSDR